ncbi:Rapamycin-insensitive companion of mTOR, N-term-domain-containing protein [Lipomyces oligophaga]|uniref:Rapamycin-insensitive companion of mTOR, N-term-domain-containing protein n=1 Tax=Lipomyces oligophaga TaxID=45792 RepID=UPI0034CF2B00
MIKLDPINTDFDRTATDSEDDESNSPSSPTWALGDLLQSLEEPDRSAMFLVSKTNELVQLLQRHPELKRELALPVFGRRVQKLLSHPAKEVVATGYRTARYAISDLDSLKTIIGLRTDAFVIRSLAKDVRFNVEREQAIKFIRGYFDITNGVDEMSLGVVCALVAVAEDTADKLSTTAIETLAELLLFDPFKVSAAGGIKVLASTLAAGPYELAESITLSFMYLLDKPDTRVVLWAAHDLDIVLSPFTELQEQDHIDEAKIRNSARVLSLMLKNWSGLFYLSMFGFRQIKAFVQTLQLPLSGLRDIMLDILFDIFNIQIPFWATPFLAGRRVTAAAIMTSDGHQRKDMQKHSLSDKYASLLLAVFIDSDLLAQLLRIIEQDLDSAISRKATLLMGEIISRSARLLPPCYAQKTQILGSLFNSATRFGTLDRFPASSAIFEIDRIFKNIHETSHSGFSSLKVQKVYSFNSGSTGGTNGANTSSSANPELRDKDKARSELKKMKLGLHLDDTHFRNLLLDTNVLSTKKFTKWNWEMLIELMQGPLMNPKRLDEAIRATKFIKRLMSFYRPFKYRFSEIPRNSANQKYVRAGAVLIKTLLANAEGVKYLTENKLLRQIAECLAQLDPMSGITSAEPLFSKHRLQTTLSYGYFTILGTLSSDLNGVAMIERWRMFNMFYHLTELPRIDLITILLSSLDYHIEGHPRILIEKVLTTGEKDVRLFATSHVATLVDFEDQGIHDWAVSLLVQQLYDCDPDVCDLAVKCLCEACTDSRTLDHVVHCLPDIEYLTDAIYPLLLRFLSAPNGLKYLHGLNYIEPQIEEWFTRGNEEYVFVVERQLAQSMFADPRKSKSKTVATPTTVAAAAAAAIAMSGVAIENDMVGTNAYLPPHFYRELVRTTDGCKLLSQKNHMKTFCQYIQSYGDPSTQHALLDSDGLTKLKACLWAVGNIGSMELGVPFLEDTEIVATIATLAATSEIWSIRGTAFFVLGLIASTKSGMEMVVEQGWHGPESVIGQPLGYCIPKGLDQFLSIKPWESAALLRPSRRGVYLADPMEKVLKQIIISQAVKTEK